MFFFFFQAEDGIRDGTVTGVQTCALPIFGIFLLRQAFKTVPRELDEAARVEGAGVLQVLLRVYVPLAKPIYLAYALVSRSEERRVGKECRSRRAVYHYSKKGINND